MKRRKFITHIALGSLAMSIGCRPGNKNKAKITHIISLSFDDGFRKSFTRTAEIYEKHNLSACFNVMAAGHFPGFDRPENYMPGNKLGDFGLWNEFLKRGHEVMPHGWAHENLMEMPIEEAKALITKSIDYFSEHLDGFDPSKAVFNFPFNASTPELNEWTVTRVRAVRTIVRALPNNPFPDKDLRILDCTSHGPDNIDKQLDMLIDGFLKSEGGWFIFNTHGLDDEGWGPMSSGYLDELLARLKNIPFIEMLPVGRALEKYT
ncbi:MAG TPA: polysaccharide deacetylase family protein [Cyclobacteriaceae bacterium]|nr:polysaccharide deacetylase family protein [Cyclobacteriaceae bacterium]